MSDKESTMVELANIQESLEHALNRYNGFVISGPAVQKVGEALNDSIQRLKKLRGVVMDDDDNRVVWGAGPKEVWVYDPDMLGILRREHGWTGCTGGVRVSETLFRQLRKRCDELQKERQDAFDKFGAGRHVEEVRAAEIASDLEDIDYTNTEGID